VSARTVPARTLAPYGALRRVLFTLGVVTLVLSLTPPLLTEAARFEFVEAIQYSLFAVVVPALLVCGAQWRWLGLSALHAPLIDDDGAVIGGSSAKLVDRIAIRRVLGSAPLRSNVVAIAYLAMLVLWRLPSMVDLLQRHRWVLGIEVLVLGGTGVAMWLELVESPPISPRRARPHRVALAAVSMWVIWTMAYLVGLSSNSWYHGFNHAIGHGISVSADQQFSTGAMWLISAAAFMPVVFWNLVKWLQQDEDPDDELYRLIRQDRRDRMSDHPTSE